MQLLGRLAALIPSPRKQRHSYYDQQVSLWGGGAGAQLAAPGSGYCVGAAGSGYPPGNQLLIPGDRFNATIVRYLEFAPDFNEKFPGLRDRHSWPGEGWQLRRGLLPCRLRGETNRVGSGLRDCDCAKWKPRSKSLLARYNCPRSRGLPFASRPEQRRATKNGFIAASCIDKHKG